MDKLIVDDLHLSYGTNPILKGVSFELKAGEVVCLLGASGSGKTTLLRAVAGLEQPSDGRIQLDDRVFFDGAQRVDLPVEQRSLETVFQSYALCRTVPSPTTSVTGSSCAASHRPNRSAACRARSTSSASAISRNASRISCRAASSSASRLRARSSTTRR